MQRQSSHKVDYRIERTWLGTWRRHVGEQGQPFAEFRSHAQLLGLPWLHYTRGVNPETGRRVVARGVIAVGRLAVGGLAIGHAAFGAVAIGQAGLGLLFGLGQAATGYWAVGQLAVGLGFGVGQLASGEVAIGQLALGKYVLAQLGFGQYLWTPEQADPEAVAFFRGLWERVQAWLGS